MQLDDEARQLLRDLLELAVRGEIACEYEWGSAVQASAMQRDRQHPGWDAAIQRARAVLGDDSP